MLLPVISAQLMSKLMETPDNNHDHEVDQGLFMKACSCRMTDNSCDSASYTLVLKGLEFGTTRHLKCKYLMVTHGILAHQYTPAERGLDTSRFRGPVSLAGKDNDVDCIAGTQDLTGKVRCLLPTAL